MRDIEPKTCERCEQTYWMNKHEPDRSNLCGECESKGATNMTPQTKQGAKHSPTPKMVRIYLDGLNEAELHEKDRS